MTKQTEREQDWATGRELERKDAEIKRLRGELSYLTEEVIRALKADCEHQTAEIERLREKLGKMRAITTE